MFPEAEQQEMIRLNEEHLPSKNKIGECISFLTNQDEIKKAEKILELIT